MDRIDIDFISKHKLNEDFVRIRSLILRKSAVESIDYRKDGVGAIITITCRSGIHYEFSVSLEAQAHLIVDYLFEMIN